MKEKNYSSVLNQDFTPKNYFSVVKENLLLITIIAILSGLLAFGVASITPKTYDTLVTVSVSKTNKQPTSDFQYDNYYAIQAAEMLGNTVVSWFKTPDFILGIYEQAEIIPTEDLNKLAKNFKAKQSSSHTIEVRVNNLDQEQSFKLAAGAVSEIEKRVSQLEINEQGAPAFAASSSSPLTFDKKYSPYLVGGIGLLAGLLIGVAAAFAREYNRKK